MTQADLLFSISFTMLQTHLSLMSKDVCEKPLTDCDGPKTDCSDCVMANHYMFDNITWL